MGRGGPGVAVGILAWLLVACIVVCCVYFSYFIRDHNIDTRLVDTECIIVNMYASHTSDLFSRDNNYYWVLNYTADGKSYMSDCDVTFDNNSGNYIGDIVECSYDSQYPWNIYRRSILYSIMIDEQWISISFFIVFVLGCLCLIRVVKRLPARSVQLPMQAIVPNQA